MTPQEINDLLAIHLFGWRPVDDPELGLWFRVPSGGLNPAGFGSEDRPPLFSSTWEGLGLVVEAMRARGRRLELYDMTDYWSACFGGAQAKGDMTNTGPMAVALAALRDLGTEVTDGD